MAAVKVIADETSRSMTQVALAWLRQRSVAVFPIVGVRKLSQLKDSLASRIARFPPANSKRWMRPAGLTSAWHALTSTRTLFLSDVQDTPTSVRIYL